jgi:phosphatidate cytidylyltransferase
MPHPNPISHLAAGSELKSGVQQPVGCQQATLGTVSSRASAVGQRLFFGMLMTVAFVAIVILDAYLDGSLSAMPSTGPAGRPVFGGQATILALLIVLLLILAHRELAKLAAGRGLSIFTPVSLPASAVLATLWYWRQFVNVPAPAQAGLLPVVMAVAILGVFLLQYLRHGTEGVIRNCGVNCLSIIYLGILSSLVLAIRIDFGPWYLLMAVFTVKSADIGAYAIGTLFGKHKFSPKISPGKTYEGMVGALIAGVVVSVVFAGISDIMNWWLGTIFGICFAIVGQAGDLVESMIKRDARQKDSANDVPGFGGVLDIIDSPLAAMPFAYLFFRLVA